MLRAAVTLANVFVTLSLHLRSGRPLALRPDDPSVAGPYVVGRRMIDGTVTARNITVEVWYPAAAGSEAGHDELVYDLRDHIPPSMAAKLSGTVYDLGIAQKCSDNPGNPPCYDRLPVNAHDGPFPLIFFVHGTAGWSGQSQQLVAHWVSRGEHAHKHG